MLDSELLSRLLSSKEEWNQWRLDNSEVPLDLSSWPLKGAELRDRFLKGVKLSPADLSEADLRRCSLAEADVSGCNMNGVVLLGANLRGAKLDDAIVTDSNLRSTCLKDASAKNVNFRGVHLRGADLRGCDLSNSDLRSADLRAVDARGAKLVGADLRGAMVDRARFEDANLTSANCSGLNLTEVSFSQATLSEADLSSALMIRTCLLGANLSGARIHGLSAWDTQLDQHTKQQDLVISRHDEPVVTVDNLEVAQFIYLLISNQKVRSVIDTITSKLVLILGRFTPERKRVLDLLRQVIRTHDYVPVLFDFEKSPARSFVETVSILANMSRFVIADVSDSRVVLQELQRIVSELPSVPVQPILAEGSDVSIAIADFMRYRSFLSPYVYGSEAELVDGLKANVLAPAEALAEEILEIGRRAEEQIRNLKRP